ncbi:GtrA family protein [Actinoplanes sp. CA-030573]|uniref:GtrA family protein n=1 Tax=Actinoplanes sp. CA-030573 TaxID=3239898 RepID=UPI003D94C675
MQEPLGLRGRPGAAVRAVLRMLPAPVRVRLLKHRELLKFLIVGGTCFVVTVAINYALKLTVLDGKPLTALSIATLVSTVLSYVLNREWAFNARGGRERHHEAALFFGINAAAILVNDIPLWFARYVLDLRVPDVSRVVQEVSDFGFGIIAGTLVAMAFRLWAYRKWVFPHPHVRLVTADPVRDEAA